MFKVVFFRFETGIRAILALINRLILRVGFSRFFKGRYTGVVFMQPRVKVNDAYYCDILLLKQLLPDICQAAGDNFQSTTCAQNH